ncbi:MAG: VTT domain-containing protein [Streptococcaceae bacterium]|jgi:uncharacterized membrane protein YdjX (TVP38/TMEM64 family)|nr:VTT domain-containing protein [Streptococcaceae bacterium]
MNSKIKIAINFISLIGFIGTILLCIYFFHLDIFNDPDIFKKIVDKRVYLGIFIFIIIQIIQVVIPIIPGGVSIAAGVLVFGPFWGFIYNYVGIIIGSFLLFFLGKVYGKPFVQTLVGKKTFNKYIGKLDNNKWDTLFAILIFFPLAPDDALVLMSSLTKMKFKKFALIMLLGKLFAIFIYSFGLVRLGQFFTNLF